MIAGAFAFVFGFGMFSWSRSHSAAWLTGLISLIAFDFSMRIRNDDEGTPLLAPNAGGHLWFIPMWILGLLGLIFVGVQWLGWV